MYLDFEDDHPDVPRVGSALSWRTQALCTLGAHVLALVGLGVAGRAISETTQVPAPVQQQMPPGETRFVFVRPNVDKPAPLPPPRAPLSDEHRVARTKERPPAPSNPMPFSRGNTWEQVERRATEPPRGKPDVPDTSAADTREAVDAAPPSAVERNAQPLPESQSARVIVPPTGDRAGSGGGGLPRGALGDALRHLDRYVQSDQLENARGGDSPYGSDIQFNTYGIDFGRWIRRFKAQVEGNWGPLIPQAVMFNHGRVVITFNVHKDGRITDVEVVAPAQIDGFNFAARGAITGSNPTVPLPPEYPIEKAFFTVTFYYNERPPN